MNTDATENDLPRRPTWQGADLRPPEWSGPSPAIRTAKGVDGAVELVVELDRLSAYSRVAANAPRDTTLYAFLNTGIAIGGRWGERSDYLDLACHLVQRLSIWWPPETYAEMPVLVPWAIRDRSARYDMGPEMWSAPREDGYLRDDNSIIKKLPLPLRIDAAPGHPYADRRPWRGFMACHLWRGLPDGSVTGTNPWLYSFIPNLVWLPMPFARLSDIESGPVQSLLQRTSVALYRERAPASSVHAYMQSAWRAIPEPSPGVTLDLASLNLFRADQAFIQRRTSYITKFIDAADLVLADGQLNKKLISSRYTLGFQQLELDSISRFAQELRDYRHAVATPSDDTAVTPARTAWRSSLPR